MGEELLPTEEIPFQNEQTYMLPPPVMHAEAERELTPEELDAKLANPPPLKPAEDLDTETLEGAVGQYRTCRRSTNR
jgi:hypothetical protein